MNIVDIPHLSPISQIDSVTGGLQPSSYDNQAVGLAFSYADGSNVISVAGTSVYIDRGLSRAQSFSFAQSSG